MLRNHWVHRLITATLGWLMAVGPGCAGGGTAPVDPDRFGYIPNAGDGTVSVIDLATLEVVRTLEVSSGVGAATSHGVAVSADGQRIFVGDALNGMLKAYSTATFELLAQIDLGIQVHGIDITPDATRIVASGSKLPSKERKVSFVVEAETLAVLAEIDTNISGHGDSTPDGRYMYINDIVGHRVAVLDLDEGQMVTEVFMGPATWDAGTVGPNEVVFAPDGLTAYTADYGSQTVSILDTSDPRAPVITGTIPVSDTPHGIDMTSDGRELWVANRGSKDVAVIDLGTAQERARISVAPYVANHVSFGPGGSRAFVTITAPDEMADQTGYVVVIDAASRSEVARIKVGVSPHELSFED